MAAHLLAIKLAHRLGKPVDRLVVAITTGWITQYFTWIFATTLSCGLGLFLAYLHSDHIADLSALSSILWWIRTEKLKLFGPAGIENLAAGIETLAVPHGTIKAAFGYKITTQD